MSAALRTSPDAQIHVTAAEALAAIWAHPREKVRYGRQQWANERNIVEHDPHGEKWRGFAAAKELDEIAPGIVLVSLPGHTRGHACVAVDAGHRWVLHCGDAFYHYGTLDGHTCAAQPVGHGDGGRLRSKDRCWTTTLASPSSTSARARPVHRLRTRPETVSSARATAEEHRR